MLGGRSWTGALPIDYHQLVTANKDIKPFDALVLGGSLRGLSRGSLPVQGRNLFLSPKQKKLLTSHPIFSDTK